MVTSIREASPPTTGATLPGLSYYLLRGKVLVGSNWNKDTQLWDIKITPVIEADPSARFALVRHGNALFDDDLTISVDRGSGLLQTANGRGCLHPYRTAGVIAIIAILHGLRSGRAS